MAADTQSSVESQQRKKNQPCNWRWAFAKNCYNQLKAKRKCQKIAYLLLLDVIYKNVAISKAREICLSTRGYILLGYIDSTKQKI